MLMARPHFGTGSEVAELCYTIGEGMGLALSLLSATYNEQGV